MVVLSAKTETLLILCSQWEASFYNVHKDKTSFSATVFGFDKQWVRKVNLFVNILINQICMDSQSQHLDRIMLSPNCHMKKF
jgi:hypothetical protein